MYDQIKTIYKRLLNKVQSWECFQTTLFRVVFCDFSETCFHESTYDEDKDKKLIKDIPKVVYTIHDYDGEAAVLRAYLSIHYLCRGNSVYHWRNLLFDFIQVRFLLIEFDRDMGVGKWHGDGVKEISVCVWKEETPHEALERFFKQSIFHNSNLISIKPIRRHVVI